MGEIQEICPQGPGIRCCGRTFVVLAGVFAGGIEQDMWVRSDSGERRREAVFSLPASYEFPDTAKMDDEERNEKILEELVRYENIEVKE